MKSLLVLGFMLTATSKGHTSDEKIALRHAATAFYKQSELEKNVNRLVKKEIPRELQVFAGNTFLIVKTIQERKIVFSWSY